MATIETDPLDETVAGSAAWWARRLQARLDHDRPRLIRYGDYYRGDHRLLFASLKYRQAFGWLFQELADDWCALVVDAAAERMTVQGFRYGGSEDADEQAWEYWQHNRLDARAPVAHTEAIKAGRCYVLVGPPHEGEEAPTITVESPLNAIVEPDPANPDRRLAALKRWREPGGRWRMTVYLPAGVFRLEAEGEGDEPPEHMNGWRPLEDGAGAWAVTNPAGVVPMVPMLNSPGVDGRGTSDLRKVIPLQDAANKLLADLLIASEFSSFRQRWATGIEVPKDEDGRPINIDLRMAVNRLLAVENPDARFGEFEASDLGNYVKAIEMIVQHVAAQTRTPPHYLLGQSGAFPSGESLKSTETGLVAKVRRKMLDVGDAWEEVMRLARAFAGGEYVRGDQVETIWADPESRTEGEHVDAVLKKKSLGVPQVALWEELGYTPQQIARFRELQSEQAAMLGLGSPVTSNPELAPAGATDGSTSAMAGALDAAFQPAQEGPANEPA